MKRSVWAGVLLAASMSVAAQSAFAECRDDQVSLRSAQGQSAFSVEIADTNEERALGLMHRASMPRFSGMLFVFDRPERAVFWMENTLIPLDMLFIDEAGVVQTVHHQAVPMDRTPIDGGPGIRYVLEINGGMARMLGLEEGTVMRHPVIPQSVAAWPCD